MTKEPLYEQAECFDSQSYNGYQTKPINSAIAGIVDIVMVKMCENILLNTPAFAEMSHNQKKPCSMCKIQPPQ